MRLAAAKIPMAQVLMGQFYFTGTGVRKDHVEAARRFREAADKDVPQGYTWLGIIYMEGYGVVQDHAEAARWLRKGVEKNDLTAKAVLGMLHFIGKGVPQDFKTAYTLARETAERGNQTGQYLSCGSVDRAGDHRYRHSSSRAGNPSRGALGSRRLAGSS